MHKAKRIFCSLYKTIDADDDDNNGRQNDGSDSDIAKQQRQQRSSMGRTHIFYI